MIRVLIVEDSPVIREFLNYVLTSDDEIEVAGMAVDGIEAVDATAKIKPDVITMDIHMPGMDGFDATRRIMETTPTPIIIVSGSTSIGEMSSTFKALEAGALAVVRRPMGIGHPEHDSSSRELIQTVKSMSEVKVVKRWHRDRVSSPPRPPWPSDHVPSSGNTRIVAIGASTGGPQVLETIVSALPRDFRVPILVVQHMAKGFMDGFAAWLAGTGGPAVHVAVHGEELKPGNVYMGPDDYQFGVMAGGKVELGRTDTENGLRPSVSYLFRSVASIYGRDAVGVLLTGMGRDGAEELKLLRMAGAVTIAQDKQSSVVYGMPGEAVKIGAAVYQLPPDKIVSLLSELVKK